jgi:hypothetical protein
MQTQHFPQERWQRSIRIHGLKYQKTDIFSEIISSLRPRHRPPYKGKNYECLVAKERTDIAWKENYSQGNLLKLNRDQLRWVVGLLTGHCHLKGHLFKLGLTDDPTCERCMQEDESATHILCDCETIAHLRFCHLGQFFTEPSDFYDAPIFRVLHFIRSVELIWG